VAAAEHRRKAPTPASPDDVVITMLGEAALIFTGSEFVQFPGDDRCDQART